MAVLELWGGDDVLPDGAMVTVVKNRNGKIKKIKNTIMKLSELLKNVEPLQVIGDTETEVTGVNIDSEALPRATCS